MTIVPENKLRPWIDKISFELMDLGADEIDYKIVLSEGIHIALGLYGSGLPQVTKAANITIHLYNPSSIMTICIKELKKS